MKKYLFFFVLFVFSGFLFAEFPEKSQSYVHMYDFANELTAEQESWFNENAHNYLQTGKAQIVTYLITNDQFDRYGNIEDAATDIFKTWGIGEKEKNNGVLIVLSPGRRKIRIEPGYGLEKWLTDGTCGNILDKNLNYYRQGQWFEALQGTFLGVQSVIDQGYQKDNETPVSPNSPQQQVSLSNNDVLIFFGILATIIIIIVFGYLVWQSHFYKKDAVAKIQELKEKIREAQNHFAKCEKEKIIVVDKKEKVGVIESKLESIYKLKKSKEKCQVTESLIEEIQTIIGAVVLVLIAKKAFSGLVNKGEKLLGKAKKKFKEKNKGQIGKAEKKIKTAKVGAGKNYPNWIKIENLLNEAIGLLKELFDNYSSSSRSSSRSSSSSRQSTHSWGSSSSSSISHSSSGFGGFGGGMSGGGGASRGF